MDKELSKALFAGKVKIENLELFTWKGERIGIYYLEAFIVYYLFKK